MAGLSQPLHQQIRQTLLTCDELYDADQLRALFAVEELRPFRSRLKIARSGDAQADLLISDLLGSSRATGENALVLFLHVLGRKYDPGNALYAQLLELAAQLQTVLVGDTLAPATPKSPTAAQGAVYNIHINQAQGLAIGDGAQVVSPSKTTSAQADRKTSNDEERTHLQKLLAQYRKNLQHLELQKSQYGAGEEPLHLLNQLDAVRETIKEIQQKLAELTDGD